MKIASNKLQCYILSQKEEPTKVWELKLFVIKGLLKQKDIKEKSNWEYLYLIVKLTYRWGEGEQ